MVAKKRKRRRPYCASGCCFQKYVCTQCRGSQAPSADPKENT